MSLASGNQNRDTHDTAPKVRLVRAPPPPPPSRNRMSSSTRPSHKFVPAHGAQRAHPRPPRPNEALGESGRRDSSLKGSSDAESAGSASEPKFSTCVCTSSGRQTSQSAPMGTPTLGADSSRAKPPCAHDPPCAQQLCRFEDALPRKHAGACGGAMVFRGIARTCSASKPELAVSGLWRCDVHSAQQLMAATTMQAPTTQHSPIHELLENRCDCPARSQYRDRGSAWCPVDGRDNDHLKPQCCQARMCTQAGIERTSNFAAAVRAAPQTAVAGAAAVGVSAAQGAAARTPCTRQRHA